MKRKQNQSILLHSGPYFLENFRHGFGGISRTEIVILTQNVGEKRQDPHQMQKEINSLGKFAILIGYEQEKCINLQ